MNSETSSSAVQSPQSSSATRPATRLMVAMGIAQFGAFTALMAPALSSVAVRIAEIAPQQRNASLSLVLGVGAVVALVSNPLLGAFSDRTRTRFGRRKPWLVGGMVGGLLGLTVLATASTVPMVLAGWCICQFAFNGTTAALLAVLADKVPHAHRGSFSAVLGAAQYGAFMAASFLVSMLAYNHVLMFLVPGLFGAACVAVLVVVLSESADLPAPERFSLLAFLKAFWVSPQRYPDFAWAWVSRFFKSAAMFTLTSYQTYFFIDRFGLPPQKAAGYVFLATVTSTIATVLGNLACGRLSDKLGRRKPFVFCSAVLLGIGLLLLLLDVPFGVLLAFIALIGLGQGVYGGVDLALVADVLPRKEESARDLGVMNCAGTLPQSLLPTVAPLLLAIGGGNNYAALFIAGGLAAVIGAFSIVFVKGVR
jgi:MFS family permease